jgi:DNA-binding NtrC family response regulator
MDARSKLGSGEACLVVSPDGAAAVVRALQAAGLEVAVARGERDALEALGRASFAAVYAALALDRRAVERLIAAAGQRLGGAPVVILGSSGTVQEAVDAMQLGADDYLAPPYPPEETVRRLARVLDRPDAPFAEPLSAGLPGLIGTSAAMRRLYAAIGRISRYKSNVLLLGESGTGKELIARALHERGPRRHHLFVPVNCATLGREILENELFGHERGAFTGANERKKGLFELADGGTFFLDEIAEMDLATQAKLLRVLERNEFRRVGGTGKVKVDLSVIAATNRDLEEAIAAGRFREDLYYRLKIVTLVVPPLRERREDIPALVDAFIADFNRRAGGHVAGTTPATLQWLLERDWPGNVRELRNAVEGACVLAAGETVTVEDFDHPIAPRVPRALRAAPGQPRSLPRPGTIPGAALSSPPPPRGSVGEGVGGGAGVAPGQAAGSADAAVAIPLSCTLADAERRIILAHLRHHRTRARAARALGIGLRTLYSKLAAWGHEGEDPAETA